MGQWPPAPEPAHRHAAAVAPVARPSLLSVARIAIVVVAAVLIAASAAAGYVAAGKWAVGTRGPVGDAIPIDDTTVIQTPLLTAELPWVATVEDASRTVGTVTTTGTLWTSGGDDASMMLLLLDGTEAFGAAPDAAQQGQALDGVLAVLAQTVAGEGVVAGVVSDEPVNGLQARSQQFVEPGAHTFVFAMASGPIIVEVACIVNQDTVPVWCSDALASIVITPPAAPAP